MIFQGPLLPSPTVDSSYNSKHNNHNHYYSNFYHHPGEQTTTEKDHLTTPLTNMKLSPSRLDNGTLIGISVGVLGPIVLLILVIVLMLTLFIAKRKSNSKKFVIQSNIPLSPIGNQAACENSLRNPTYTGGMESVAIIFIYQFGLFLIFTISKLPWDQECKPIWCTDSNDSCRRI